MITQASWIYPESEVDPSKRYPASYLRKRFHLDHLTGATLYITCHGLFAAYINGQRISDSVLDPGPGNYKKRLEYRAIEVTRFLQEGENTLLVVLGDGWFRGCTGIDGQRNLYGEKLALLCTLEDEAGNLLLVSDDSWEASQQGPIRFADMEQGERYHAAMEEVKVWHKVSIGREDSSVLVLSESVPITEHEHFPGSLITTPNGQRVLDFGQNLAGYVHMRFMAHAGDRILLWHGETLDENGNFTQSNYDPGSRNKEGGIPQKIEYLCKEGLNDYQPLFSIFGFRYALIETAMDLSGAIFEAVAVYSNMEEVGQFECSEAAVNQLFSNAMWSMKSNFCGIPTDCPTRERAGWTGDAAAFVDTGMFFMDCQSVYRKWLKECALGQSKDGTVPNIAPPNNDSGIISRIIKGSAGWGDAATIVPMALYRVYGDLAILSENYEMMQAWVELLIRRAGKSKLKNRFKKNPYRNYVIDTGFHFGEWKEPDIDSATAMRDIMSKGAPELVTAYFAHSADLLSQAAEILGKEEDARKYKEVSEKAALAWHFIATENGSIHSDRQADYVRPLAFGLLKGEEAASAASALNDLVIAKDYHLNTGFLSTPFLCQVLSENGYVESAYRLLLQKEFPSWLYAVGHGATSIWETWDGIRPDGTVHDSLNHYSYGAVCGWLFGGVCGIHYDRGRITIAPTPHPLLSYAKASWKSPKGTIKSAWRYEGETPVYTITIPEGKEAQICLPDGRTFTAPAGRHEYR